MLDTEIETPEDAIAPLGRVLRLASDAALRGILETADPDGPDWVAYAAAKHEIERREA